MDQYYNRATSMMQPRWQRNKETQIFYWSSMFVLLEVSKTELPSSHPKVAHICHSWSLQNHSPVCGCVSVFGFRLFIYIYFSKASRTSSIAPITAPHIQSPSLRWTGFRSVRVGVEVSYFSFSIKRQNVVRSRIASFRCVWLSLCVCDFFHQTISIISCCSNHSTRPHFTDQNARHTRCACTDITALKRKHTHIILTA